MKFSVITKSAKNTINTEKNGNTRISMNMLDRLAEDNNEIKETQEVALAVRVLEELIIRIFSSPCLEEVVAVFDKAVEARNSKDRTSTRSFSLAFGMRRRHTSKC